ncbi:DUF7504 family protein [Halorubrum halodurans]|uniref:KaiC-like domain-containing protein n=1 Tax=Halorubrum halodurans TaxID=1383851 RepID=A0A256IRC2_9EURY|nr:hypothetical protein [Halorubrum halodurans]OYR58993.1 hypothetical protein DJ70_01610 [Halorubrum halodurans]
MSDDETADDGSADGRSSRFGEISSRLDEGEADESDERDLTAEEADDVLDSWEWIDDRDDSDGPAAPDESAGIVDAGDGTDDAPVEPDPPRDTRDESSVHPADGESEGDDESKGDDERASRVWNTGRSEGATGDASEPDDGGADAGVGGTSEVETDEASHGDDESPFEVVESPADGPEPPAGTDDDGSSTSGGDGDPASTAPRDPDGEGGPSDDTTTDDDSGETVTDDSGETVTDDSEGTSADAARPEPTSAEAEEHAGKKRRVWSSSETTRDATSSDRDGSREGSERPTPSETFDDVSEDSDGYEPPRGLNATPQTSVLVQCGSQDDRKDAACDDLLGLSADGTERSVVLIQYRKVDPARLERIAEESRRTKLISVGYSQTIPGSIEDEIETVKINNPNDITRLGILVSGTLDDWSSVDGETAVCYDSLNVLLKYKDVQSTFRFLHVFLGTLDGANAVSHFHVDPLAGDPQNINTLKPLFDEVVSIDSMGVHLE